MRRYRRSVLHGLFLVLVVAALGRAQTAPTDQPRFPHWYPYQLIPNLLLHTASARTVIGAEWEATPLLYSWGINPKVSPWSSFIVVPTSRFSGSIEWTVAARVFSGKVGGSYFGVATHLMSHFPLSDVGELAGLNLGAGLHGAPDGWRLFKVAGISTAFGMLHFNIAHADRPTTWIGSVEVRIY